WYAKPHVDAMQALAEEEQDRDDEQDGDEQRPPQPPYAPAAPFEARHLPGEVGMLTLDPRLIDAALLAPLRLARRPHGDLAWLDTLENKADPAEAPKAVDARQGEHLRGIDPPVGAREPQVETRAQRLGECTVGEVLAEPMSALQYVVHAEAREQRQQIRHEQHARLGELLVHEVSETHGESHDGEQVEQTVRAALEVHGERVGLAVLLIDVRELAPLGNRQVYRQHAQQRVRRR